MVDTDDHIADDEVSPSPLVISNPLANNFIVLSGIFVSCRLVVVRSPSVLSVVVVALLSAVVVAFLSAVVVAPLSAGVGGFALVAGLFLPACLIDSQYG